MPNSPPQFLYFDLGNVLLSFDPLRLARQVSAATHVSPELTHAILFESDLYVHYECGRISSAAVHEAFQRQSAARSAFETFHAAACDVFEPIEANLALVEQLHRGGVYRLGILSNTNDGHWRYIGSGRYPAVTRCFERHVLSFKLGIMKPDRRIYDTATRLAAVPRERIFFVDDRAENVVAAGAAGWDAVQYTDPLQLATALRDRGVRWQE
jgi:FMN phosphatase YigB (HAD superfamily)